MEQSNDSCSVRRRRSELARVLEALGFSPARARQSATLFAETHRDGVASHGLNRFPRFVRQIKAGIVRPDAEPVCAARSVRGSSGTGNSALAT